MKIYSSHSCDAFAFLTLDQAVNFLIALRKADHEEIKGDCQSCPNCITENEGHNYGNKIKGGLEKVVAVIKDCFPQATAKIRVKCYKVDADSPTYEIKA